MEEIKFKKSPEEYKKAIRIYWILVLISIVFGCVGIFSSISILISICTLFLIVGLTMLFLNRSNKATVIINEKGIWNRTNGMNWVSWKYIEGFEMGKAINTEVIVVQLSDQEIFLKEKNFLSRSVMKTNINKLGSPVVIAKQEFDQPLSVVLENLREAKRQWDV